MFSHIKTSGSNKEIITKLTNKLGLGAENVIARMAISYSLEKGDKLELEKLQDAKGKEYSRSVLFGEHENVYIGMLRNHYQLDEVDTNLGKYVKLHLDQGVEDLNRLYEANPNVDGFEFLVGITN